MIISISFVLAVVLGMLVYILNDTTRGSNAGNTEIEAKAKQGANLFGQNCSQCHGPKGEGAIGPALVRPEWRADVAGFDVNSASNVIRTVVTRGQYSPQPGIQMPAWSKDFGGPFNDQQIEDVITFIMYGNWDEPLEYTSSPNYVADLPANSAQLDQYPDQFSDKLKAKYPNAATDKAQADALKAEGTKNSEQLRLILGNNKPGETLNGLKQLIQTKGCLNCHALGSAGSTLGPTLTNVGSRRTADWLYKWIQDPSKVEGTQRGPNLSPWFEQDNRTKFWPMNPTFMPTIQMTDEERQKIVDYLKDLKVPAVKVTK
jgi:mono/diheme cytochrome c family protein